MKKSIIIGCGNIGFATLCKLSEQGREIIVYDLKDTPPQYLDEYIQEHRNVQYRAINAAVESSVIKAFTELGEDSVDFVLDTVGLNTPDTPLDNFTGYSKVIDVNVLGNIIPIRVLVNKGIVSAGSRIVVVGSTSGHFAGGTLDPYSVSKWILVNICSSLQHELTHKGITLKVVNPRTIQNVRSDVFRSSWGISVDSVVSKILSDGYQSFCPWYYGLFHIIERICPWIFDKAFGLSFHFSRKKSYQGDFESVLITGASSGLGKELAYRFAGHCKTLYLAARNQEALQEIKQNLSDYPCEVIPLRLELSDYDSVRKVAEEINKVDLIVNNAGQQMQGSVIDADVELYRKSIRVNCLSHILLTAELMKKEQKPKCVVNVLSTTAVSGRTNMGMYSSPKAGLWAWCKVLRRQYGKEINVIEVIPATFESGLHSKSVSSAEDSEIQGKSLVKSSNMGLTSKDVSEIVYRGIVKRRDRIMIPSFKVKTFIALEALSPTLYRKMFS